MAQAGVADFQGGFGDIIFAGFQQGGGAFHAQLPDVLGDGHFGDGREGAA